MVDWKEIQTEYITTNTSYRKLAEKYSLPLTTIAHRAKTENWVAEKKRFNNKVVTKTLENAEKSEVEKITRINSLTDKLLDKIEQAISELDLMIAKNVTKTKVIEYNNEERPDKPTKEVIEEVETINDIKTIIDRSGLKQISSALKDIKETQMLKSNLDNIEQEARIANLQKQAKEDDKSDKKIVVCIKGDADEYSS